MIKLHLVFLLFLAVILGIEGKVVDGSEPDEEVFILEEVLAEQQQQQQQAELLIEEEEMLVELGESELVEPEYRCPAYEQPPTSTKYQSQKPATPCQSKRIRRAKRPTCGCQEEEREAEMDCRKCSSSTFSPRPRYVIKKPVNKPKPKTYYLKKVVEAPKFKHAAESVPVVEPAEVLVEESFAESVLEPEEVVAAFEEEVIVESEKKSQEKAKKSQKAEAKKQPKTKKDKKQKTKVY